MRLVAQPQNASSKADVQRLGQSMLGYRETDELLGDTSKEEEDKRQSSPAVELCGNAGVQQMFRQFLWSCIVNIGLKKLKVAHAPRHHLF